MFAHIWPCGGVTIMAYTRSESLGGSTGGEVMTSTSTIALFTARRIGVQRTMLRLTVRPSVRHTRIVYQNGCTRH